MNTFKQSQYKIDNPTPFSAYVVMAVIVALMALLLLVAPSMKTSETNIPEMLKSSGSTMEKPQQHVKVAKT